MGLEYAQPELQLGSDDLIESALSTPLQSLPVSRSRARIDIKLPKTPWMTAVDSSSNIRSMGQPSAKDEVAEILKGLPEDATLEDVQYRIYVRQRIARGEAEANEGQTLSQDEVKARLRRWLAS